METLPTEVMDKIFGYLDNRFPGRKFSMLKNMRLVSKGFHDFTTPTLFNVLVVHDHPRSEDKARAIANSPSLARHVQKIRTKSLVSPVKLIDSDVNVDVLIQDESVIPNPYYGSIRSSGYVSAGTTATYASNRTYVWRTKKERGGRLQATTCNSQLDPFFGVPRVDLYLFPQLEDIELGEDWRGKMLKQDTYNNSGPRCVRQWSSRDYCKQIEIDEMDIEENAMSLIIQSRSQRQFEIESFRLIRYWEILYHQAYAALNFKGMS